MTLEEQLAYSAARLKKPSAPKDAAPANDAPKPVPEKRLEDMTLEEQLAYSASRLKKNKNSSKPPSPKEEKKERAMSVIVEETKQEDITMRDEISKDSFCTDASMIETQPNESVVNTDRMTVIEEDDDESRATEYTKEVKPPVIQPPPPQVVAPQPKTVNIKPPIKSAATIKTTDRRMSNIDMLKAQLAARQQTMHGGRCKKAPVRRKDDSSDDNESSDDSDGE